jgi:hypothetical protein
MPGGAWESLLPSLARRAARDSGLVHRALQAVADCMVMRRRVRRRRVKRWK